MCCPMTWAPQPSFPYEMRFQFVLWSWIVILSCGAQLCPESFECFIYRASGSSPHIIPSPVSKRSNSNTQENGQGKLTCSWARRGSGWARSRIIRPQESLVLCTVNHSTLNSIQSKDGCKWMHLFRSEYVPVFSKGFKNENLKGQFPKILCVSPSRNVAHILILKQAWWCNPGVCVCKGRVGRDS
jgi:hypothetical protein